MCRLEPCEASRPTLGALQAGCKDNTYGSTTPDGARLAGGGSNKQIHGELMMEAMSKTCLLMKGAGQQPTAGAGVMRWPNSSASGDVTWSRFPGVAPASDVAACTHGSLDRTRTGTPDIQTNITLSGRGSQLAVSGCVGVSEMSLVRGGRVLTQRMYYS